MFKSILSDEMALFMKQREASFAKSTVKGDRSVLSEFDRYLGSIGWDEKNIPEPVVNGWIASLDGRRSTLQFKVGVMQVFFRYLNSMGIGTFMPPTPAANDDYVPYIYSGSEVARIFEEADNLEYHRQNPCRNIQIEFPMVLRLLYGCGLRIGEALALKTGDLDLDSGIVTIRQAKGLKQRVVPMEKYLWDLMRLYCCRMGLAAKPDSYLFPGKTEDDHLKTSTVYKVFSLILKKTGIQQPGRKWHERGPCIHTWRHTFTVESFRKAEESGRSLNDSVPFLSVYLGHNSLNETDKYLKFSSELFKDDISRFSDFSKDLYREVPNEEE